MQLRTQAAIITVIAAGWSAGNTAVVLPFLAPMPSAERERLAQLESRVAGDADDVMAARQLARQYLDRGLPHLVVETIRRMGPAVQNDGRVALLVARAHESLGEVSTAAAMLSGVLRRCSAVPLALAAGAGCDVHTLNELWLESAALDRMIAWNVTPVNDPERAAVAHDLAAVPVRLAR